MSSRPAAIRVSSLPVSRTTCYLEARSAPSPLGDHVRRRLVTEQPGRVGMGIDEGDDVVDLESGTGFPTTCIIGWPSEMVVQL
jgi:hypothetical protein